MLPQAILHNAVILDCRIDGFPINLNYRRACWPFPTDADAYAPGTICGLFPTGAV